MNFRKKKVLKDSGYVNPKPNIENRLYIQENFDYWQPRRQQRIEVNELGKMNLAFWNNIWIQRFVNRGAKHPLQIWMFHKLLLSCSRNWLVSNFQFVERLCLQCSFSFSLDFCNCLIRIIPNLMGCSSVGRKRYC